MACSAPTPPAPALSPRRSCSRGAPRCERRAGFSDVAADAYYAQAVAWAKEHGITDGIGGGLFGSANDCTRAQIAAFLWRLYAEK
ncbi:MAG: S-layer homology domain-containing protein [Gemmiger formicilis]|uniref:S-layer homology domain-containing protein n=1 Tax=Gemmiger formicilis TaxID=745368 RepID=UPI0039957CF0